MTSNVYLAFGVLEDQPVMKVGKANDVSRRQKEIKISIELSCPCNDETQAFNLETKLRRLMRGLGATRIATRHDWHVFDGGIYDQVKQMLVDSFGVEVLKAYDGKGDIVDFEIALLQSRYQELIDEELKRDPRFIEAQKELAKVKKQREGQVARHAAELKAIRRQVVETNTSIALMKSELHFWHNGILRYISPKKLEANRLLEIA